MKTTVFVYLTLVFFQETEPQQEEADGNQRMQRDTDENTKTVELAVFTDKYMYSSMSKMYEESAIEEVANLIFGFVNGVSMF